MTAPAQAEQPVADEPVWIQPDVLKYIRKEKERNACGVVYGTPSEHHTVPLYAHPAAWVDAGGDAFLKATHEGYQVAVKDAAKICADIAVAQDAKADSIKMMDMNLANFFRGKANIARECSGDILALLRPSAGRGRG